MATVTTIKIAPNLEEIHLSGNTFTTEFNGMRIQYTLRNDTAISLEEEGDTKTIDAIKRRFQNSIAMASKTWQLQSFMDSFVTVHGKSAGTINVTTLG